MLLFVGCGLVSLNAGDAEAQYRPGGRQRRPAPTAPATSRASRSSPASTGVQQRRSNDDEATLARLFANALDQPENRGIVERIAQLGSRHPEALGRNLATLQGASREATPKARNASLLLQALYEQLGQLDDARRVAATTLARYPDDRLVLEFMADRSFARGESQDGRVKLVAALDHATEPAERQRLLRRLRNANLDAGDVTGAAEFQRRLLAVADDKPRTALEFGRELLARAEARAALDALLPLTRGANLDQSTKRQLLRDVASAAWLAADLQTARQYADLAWTACPSDIERCGDLKQTITEIYRSSVGLEVLEHEVATRGVRSPSHYAWLAELNEELGRIDAAVGYRRMVAANRPRDREARLALLRVLELAGDRAAEWRERESLVTACPDCIDQAIALALEWYRRGQRQRAARILETLERRPRLGPDWTYQLADAWERIDLRERAQRLLARSTTNAPVAASIASATSRGISGVAGEAPRVSRSQNGSASESRAAIWLRQADAAIDAGHVDEAVQILERVQQTHDVSATDLARTASSFERAAASATKQSASWRERAEQLWTTLLTSGSLPPSEVVQAIDHVVRIWTLRGSLAEQALRLRARFGDDPANRTLGLWLAEVESTLGARERAQRILGGLSEKWPNDPVIFDKLGALASKGGNLEQALAIAERQLAGRPRLDPASLQRLIELAEAVRQDDRAARYAKRWVEVAPTDANAWHRYARLLRRGASANARETLLRACQLDPNRHDLALELADWETQDGDTTRAFERLLSILRTSSKESLVMEAGRRCVVLGAPLRRLEQVELALSQASARLATSVDLRGLLLELTAALVQDAATERQSADAARSEAARALLLRVGQRAPATLARALLDREQAHQQMALELLSEIPARSVVHELVAFATSQASEKLRVRALLLAADQADPSLLQRFETIVESNSTPLAMAAAFGISRVRSPEATARLRFLLRHSNSDLRGFAALWLAERADHEIRGRLDVLQRSLTEAPTTRAAAAASLMQLSAAPTTAAEYLPLTASRIERQVRLSRLALGRAPEDMTQLTSLLALELQVDSTAVALATRLVGAPCPDWHAVLSRSDSTFDLEQTLHELTRCRATYHDRLELLSRIATPLGHAVRRLVESGPASAKAIGRLLLAGDPEIGSLLLGEERFAASKVDQERASSALAAALGPPAAAYSALLQDPDPELRQLAVGVRVLTHSDEAALLCGLADAAPEVRLAALRWAKRFPTDPVRLALGNRLRQDPSGVVRQRAAEVLGVLVALPMRRELAAALRQAARSDPFSGVRMAALSSLVRTNPLAAAEELSYAELHDSEPEVVRLARRLREHRP